MMPQPGSAVSRCAAMALLLAVAALLWAGVAAPLLARHGGVRERVSTIEDQIARFRATLVAGSGATAPLPAGLVSSPVSLALASADLQQRVDGAMRSSGAERNASQPLDPTEAEGATILSVRIDGMFDAGSLAEFLYQIETDLPLMFVERLEIQRDGGDLEADPLLPTILAVQATISTVIARDGIQP